MTTSDAQSWMLIISTVTTSLVTLITAWNVKRVHNLVNSAMTEEKAENSMLRSILAAKQVELATAMRVLGDMTKNANQQSEPPTPPTPPPGAKLP